MWNIEVVGGVEMCFSMAMDRLQLMGFRGGVWYRYGGVTVVPLPMTVIGFQLPEKSDGEWR